MAAQLLFTDEQKADFKSRFEAKANGDGSITKEELGAFLEATGKKCTDQQLTKMISDADTDNSGTIELSEFLMDIARKMVKWQWKESHYTKAFDDLDKDGNGTLSLKELRAGLRAIDPPMKGKKIKAIFEIADANGDGKICREEFVKLIQST